VGGFRGGIPGKVKIAPGDPLGLKALDLNWGQGDRIQSVDPSTLPAGDKIIPLTTVGGSHFAAMVLHQGDDYDGAVDVWTTNDLRYDSIGVAYGTEQLLERGTLAALAQKKLISKAEKESAFKILAKEPRPRFFANLTLPRVTRPYPTLQPKMPKPARSLYVADVEHLPHDQQL
jgi:hypothetical protein